MGQKMHVKSGDEVVVIAGNEKGNSGKVLVVSPQTQRVIVEGLNLRKRHQKATKENPEGSIVEREAPIHVSNVMLKGKFEARQNKATAS